MTKNISNICETLYKYCLTCIPQVENDEIIWILNGSVLCNILANVETIDGVPISSELHNLFKMFVRVPKGDIDICYKADRTYKFNLESEEVKEFYKISEEKRTFNFVDSNSEITKDDYEQLCIYKTINGLQFYAKKPQYLFLYKFKEYVAMFWQDIVNGNFDEIKIKRKNIIADVENLYAISCEYFGEDETLNVLNNKLCDISEFFHNLYLQDNNQYYEVINYVISTIKRNKKSKLI